MISFWVKVFYIANPDSFFINILEKFLNLNNIYSMVIKFKISNKFDVGDRVEVIRFGGNYISHKKLIGEIVKIQLEFMRNRTENLEVYKTGFIDMKLLQKIRYVIKLDFIDETGIRMWYAEEDEIVSSNEPKKLDIKGKDDLMII